MTTGTDDLILTASPPAAAIPAFLDDWSRTWPELLVDAHDEGFVPWVRVRTVPLSDQGDILVVRDLAMDLAWAEHGYDLPGQDEGPFMLMYRPCPVPVIDGAVLSDPYSHETEIFQPYPVQIVGSGIHLVTIVTPSNSPEFTATIIDRLLIHLVTRA
jgi:hypothetical protein